MRRPSRTVLAGGGAAVAALVAVLVVTRGDEGSGGCLTDMVGHMPTEAGSVSGSDLDRARAAGLAVDGGDEQLGEVVVDTALRLDPLTRRRVELRDDSTAPTGFAVEDMRCWLGAVDQAFVGRGSFDEDAVAASPAGDDRAALVEGDLIAYDPDGDPGALLEPPEGEAGAVPPVLATAVETLDRHEAVTFDVVATGDEPDSAWVGIGLAHGDGWQLLGVWSFADAGLAADERDDVVAAITQGTVGDMVAGDPETLVHREGRSLWMRAPLRDDVAGWARPVAVFDPVLTVVADFPDGN